MNIEQINNDGVRISSREIAELTGKLHKNVIRDVRSMLEELELGRLNFEHTYLDSQNKEQVEYMLDKELTQCLTTGYSVKLRMKVIKRLNILEAANAPKELTFEEQVVKTLTTAKERIFTLEAKIEVDAPRVLLSELKEKTGTSILIRDFLKVSKLWFGGKPLKEKDLKGFLRTWGWIFKDGTRPQASTIQAGWMTCKSHTYLNSKGEPHESFTGRITEKGQILLLTKLAKVGIVNEEEAA